MIGSIAAGINLSHFGYYFGGVIDFGTSNINIESDVESGIASYVNLTYMDLITSDCNLYIRGPSIYIDGIFDCQRWIVFK